MTLTQPTYHNALNSLILKLLTIVAYVVAILTGTRAWTVTVIPQVTF